MILKRIYVHGNREPWGYSFYCPGCRDVHPIPVESPGGWSFNGSESAPTFSPSLLNYEVKLEDGKVHSPRCHLFVTDGKILYCTDCGHDHAGKTVPMVDIPEEPEVA